MFVNKVHPDIFTERERERWGGGKEGEESLFETTANKP